uniref:Uncharacterized protein n=1 Tax=Seriola lalandi dorsalis TaxID=1841481 RepID=A0A3B4WSP3_SERLL
QFQLQFVDQILESGHVSDLKDILGLNYFSFFSYSTEWLLSCLDSYPGFQFLKLLLPSLQSYLLCLIQALLQVFHRGLQVLLHPLQVGAGLDFHLIQISLHLLLRPDSIISAAGLGVQRALQGVHGPLVIPLEVVDFFVLLRHLSVHF